MGDNYGVWLAAVVPSLEPKMDWCVERGEEPGERKRRERGY